MKRHEANFVISSDRKIVRMVRKGGHLHPKMGSKLW